MSHSLFWVLNTLYNYSVSSRKSFLQAMPYPFIVLSLNLLILYPSLHYNCPLFSLSAVSSLRTGTVSDSPFYLQCLSAVVSTSNLPILYLGCSDCVSPQKSEIFFFNQQVFSHLCMPKLAILPNIKCKNLRNAGCCTCPPFVFSYSSFSRSLLALHS